LPISDAEADRVAPVPRRRVLAGIAATAAVAGCAPADEARDSADSLRPSGQFIDVGGTRLHYRTFGDAGPQVVALHGASGNLLDWAQGPAQAMARTHRVLLFDRPGHGFSTRSGTDSHRLGAQAAAMRQAATRLGWVRPVVVGHSFGGAVALAWALDAPAEVAGLVLMAAPSQVWPGSLGPYYTLAGNRVTGPLVSRLIPAVASDRVIREAVTRVFAPQVPPPGYLANVGPELALEPRNIRANAVDVAALKAQLGDMAPRYPTLTMPVAILHGTADRTVPIDIHSDVLARQVPRVRYRRLDGIGHMPHHAATPELLAALDWVHAG
jgi:pimeloyl-ACP methyl ester carboxylesterase